jgi:hypothetical protein
LFLGVAPAIRRFADWLRGGGKLLTQCRINNPKITIDRVTRIVTSSGKAGVYSGQCQAVPADAPARF